MRDRDDIDMESWARRAFEAEPPSGSLGSTVRDDLTRAHAGLTTRRRWRAAGTSGVAVAAVAFAIAMAPGLRDAVPSGNDDPAPAGPVGQHQKSQSDSSEQTKQKGADHSSSYTPLAELRRMLQDVAADHLDPDGEHLEPTTNLGGTTDFELLNTKMGWTNPGEPGEGVVAVGIAKPGYPLADVRDLDVGCDEEFGGCERRVLSDGGVAWVGQTTDGTLGVAYRQPDGDVVYVYINRLNGNDTLTPVENMDISVADAIGFVTDERLDWAESDKVMTWDGRLVPRGCPRGDGENIIYPDDPPPDQIPDYCPPTPKD